jgi:putative ABC transport system permease protein
VRPWALLRLAGRDLLLHRLRSSLSALGVVFGVAAVTAMSSVGEGARREALAQVGALGIDGVTLRSRGAVLRLSDAESLAAVVPGVTAVAPLREAALLAEAGPRHLEVSVLGTTLAYGAAARLDVAEGRFLTALDATEANRVAVLGAGVARSLFPLGDWKGAELLLGGDPYRVVGVLAGRGSARSRPGAIRARDVNRCVLVPITALDRGASGSRPDGVDELALRLSRAEDVVAAAELARAHLRRVSGSDALDVVVPREILRQRERTQRVFDVVTGAVAAISLLVSGIGIMNIMLASVAERTREVGIRRALGATQREIAFQFLAQAGILTLGGGVMGALLGLLGSLLIEWLAGWPTATSPAMLALALLAALLVGIGFGAWPAWRAAQLEPMEALRRE